jgi:hypothetical protein
MHRSGTSALAGALSCLGIQFLSSSDELFRGIDNPNGFYERPSVLAFSDTLLETHAWAWHTVNLYPFDVDKAVDLLSQGRNLIASLSNDSPVGIKDPRSCLLMPFWRRALLDRFEAIVITRDPAEVAWSLHVRDGLTVTVGLALWIAYNTHLANGIQGMDPHILRYENLVDSPATELTSIAQFLHERGMPVLHQESDLGVAAKSIDPTLRRATVPDWVNDHPLTVEARSIRELFHQATETDISFTPSVLCSEVLEYQRISQKFLKVNHQLNLAQLEINQIRSTHELLEQHVNDLQHRLHTQEKAQAALEEKNTQIEESFSLRLGLALTWPVRKLRSANRKR